MDRWLRIATPYVGGAGALIVAATAGASGSLSGVFLSTVAMFLSITLARIS